MPLILSSEEIIPALDHVGKGFEAGTVFLPQLLMSAEAAKAAFEVIKEKMQESGQTQEKKGKVILATVKGDIHDIGKNIVKVLLENYSYDVVDLGQGCSAGGGGEDCRRTADPAGRFKCADDHNRTEHGGDHPPAPQGGTLGKGNGRRRGADRGICTDHGR